MITYPLNNIEYSAEDAELFHATRTSGVYANNSFNYSLIGGNDIQIGSGIAWIKNSEFAGKVVAEKKNTVINMGITDAVYSRIDAVVIQFNAETNETTFVVKQGVLATEPVAPEVVRTSNIYELHLYHILRPAGAVSLSAADITDMRLLPEYCGIMADSVTSVDTTAIQQQIDAFIENARSQTSSFIDEARSETQGLISNTSTAVENFANETEQKYNEAQDDIDKLISDTEERLDDIAADVKANVETNNTVASVKDVPENSLPYSEVVEIGGMTQRVNVGTDEAPEYVLRSAPVTEVESVGANLLNESILSNDTTWQYKTLQAKPNTVYTARGTAPLIASIGVYVMNSTTGADTKYQLYVGNTVTFTTNADGIIKIQYRSSADLNVLDYVYQINEGTTAQPYTPYVRNTLPIPEAVRNLDGYGWGINADCYNYIDFEKKQFVKRAGKTVFDGSADEGWVYVTNETNPCFRAPLRTSKEEFCALCSHFKHKNYPYVDLTGAKGIFGWDSSFTTVYFASEQTSVDEWKAWLSANPVTVCYKLAEPVITDISDLLPADNPLPVEGGGTVTMVNEFGYDVPNTVVFYEGTNEVIGADTLVGDLVGTASRAICDSEGNKIDKTYLKQKDLPTSMPPTAHNQAASTITAGTFAGQVVANASGQPAGVSCVRNSKYSFDESVLPTVEGESVWYLE